MHAFDFHQGTAPLLVSMPHVGTDIPTNIAPHFTADALQKPDTDWHLPRLYDFLQAMGASVLAARWSRYVIDLNRPDNDTNLYPGQDTTGLCPVDTFGKAALYMAGHQPDPTEIGHRLRKYWQPYHSQLQAELQRLLALHGKVVLWDAHSIASQVPRFFSGKLPDLNLGSADGTSCDPGLMAAVAGRVGQQATYTLAVNGRFKGGHITRHYGAPGQGVHALQLEMCQSTYMDETAPFGYRPDLADQVKPLLKDMVQAALDWVKS